MYEKKNTKKYTVLSLFSHHTVIAVQLIYKLMKRQVQYDGTKKCK